MREPEQERREPGARPSGEIDPGTLRAMAGLDAEAQYPVVNRTRRAIRVADERRRIKGKQDRRQMGLALFAISGVLVLLAPALWSWVDDLLGGEHFFDLPTQALLIGGSLLLAVVATLALLWRGQGMRDGSRRES